MDETDTKKKKEIQAHNHLIEQELQNHPGYQAYLAKQSYEVNRTQMDESLKIPGPVYSNLSRDSKIAIRNFNEDDRRTLVSAMTSESGFKHNRNVYAACTTQSQEEFDFVQDDDLSQGFDALATSFEAYRNQIQKSTQSSVQSSPSRSGNPTSTEQKTLKSALGHGHPAVIMADGKKQQNAPSSNRNAYNVEFGDNDYQLC